MTPTDNKSKLLLITPLLVAAALLGVVMYNSNTAANLQNASSFSTDSSDDCSVDCMGTDEPVLEGYDVVEYFNIDYDNGDAAVLGSSEFAVVYDSYTYYFVNEANKELFSANPTKYAPAYGSYCAWAFVYQYDVNTSI